MPGALHGGAIHCRERGHPFGGAHYPWLGRGADSPALGTGTMSPSPPGWGTPPGPHHPWALTHGLQREMHKVGSFILQRLVGLHRDIDVAEALLVAHMDLRACRVGRVSTAAPPTNPPAPHHPHQPPGRSRRRQ